MTNIDIGSADTLKLPTVILAKTTKKLPVVKDYIVPPPISLPMKIQRTMKQKGDTEP